MILPGTIEPSTPFAPGFDTDSILTSTRALQFYNLGYKFCLRYLSLGEQSTRDLTAEEADDILNSGLALMPVQHVRRPGWSPSASLGGTDGQNAASNARQIGFPAGVNIWCDLEGVNRAASQQDVIDYCESWHASVRGAGFLPGLYVGANSTLTGDQLRNLSFQHYWKSQSNVPAIPGRDYQLIQFRPSVTANGIVIDVDFAQSDNLGGQPEWLRLDV